MGAVGSREVDGETRARREPVRVPGPISREEKPVLRLAATMHEPLRFGYLPTHGQVGTAVAPMFSTCMQREQARGSSSPDNS